MDKATEDRLKALRSQRDAAKAEWLRACEELGREIAEADAPATAIAESLGVSRQAVYQLKR